MLPLRIRDISSRTVVLSIVLLFGTSAIFTSLFAIVSGEWIHVFRSEPEVAGSRHEEDSTHLRNISLGFDPGICCVDESELVIDMDDVGSVDVASADALIRGGVPAIEGGVAVVEEAFGGLWTVCLVHRCFKDGRSAVCHRYFSASDPVLQRRFRCHVSSAILAITGDASRASMLLVVAAVVLCCGLSLEIFGFIRQNLFLIVASFCFAAAGLLQFLGLFLYTMVVNDEMKSRSFEESIPPIRYNYDRGFIFAIVAFLASNLSAISAAYSFRRRQVEKWLPLATAKAISLVPVPVNSAA